jgi:hypothetical protein
MRPNSHWRTEYHHVKMSDLTGVDRAMILEVIITIVSGA